MMNSESPVNNDRLTEFIRLLTEYDNGLLAFILSLVPHWADAEEIHQETNIKLWQEFDKFQLGSDFRVWARTIAWYEVLAFRKRKQRSWLRTSPMFLEVVAADAEALDRQAGTRRELLGECVEELSSFTRKLLRFHYAWGWKVNDIARKVRSTPDIVYKTLRRARIDLRQCVDRKLSERGTS
jgi:RNA polymerase sigma-70 factor, ECF subfamily